MKHNVRAKIGNDIKTLNERISILKRIDAVLDSNQFYNIECYPIEVICNCKCGCIPDCANICKLEWVAQPVGNPKIVKRIISDKGNDYLNVHLVWDWDVETGVYQMDYDFGKTMVDAIVNYIENFLI